MARGQALWSRVDEARVLAEFEAKRKDLPQHPTWANPYYDIVDRAIERVLEMKKNRLKKHRPKQERYMNAIDDYYEMIKRIAAMLLIFLTLSCSEKKADKVEEVEKTERAKATDPRQQIDWHKAQIERLDAQLDSLLIAEVGTKGDTLRMIRMMQHQVIYFHDKIIPHYKAITGLYEQQDE